MSSLDKKLVHSRIALPRRRLTTPLARIALLLLALVFSALLFFGDFSNPADSTTYAICSHGSNIYIVDTLNSRTYLDSIQRRRTSTVPLRVRYIPDGAMIVPGISESHAHIMHYGLYRQIPLEMGRNISETVSFVENYIVSNPDIYNNMSKVIEGWGWDHTAWPESRFPTAADLDTSTVIRGRSVMLRSKDGHGTWVSGRVLQDIRPLPRTVEGGMIVRDKKGQPAGVFLDNAQELLPVPIPTEEDYERRFSTTVRNALANGLTSIHDAKLDFQQLDFFRRYSPKAAAGKLPIRLYGMTNYDEGEEYWGNITKPQMLSDDHRFSARSVKIVGDGSMRTGGAALYEPYTDNPTTNGFMRVSEATINRVIPLFLRDGWQVNVHAIGDRANGIVLDALESAFEDVNAAARRPRLEHAQIMAKADIKRAGKIGVIASVQPTHVIDDMWYAEERIGPERIKGLYAFRSLLNSGARITLGSDFPVETMNPLAGFYAAITRVSLDGNSPHGPGGWFPEQRLTRLEALRGMTIDPAYASFTESVLGSLEPGKRADFVVLSQNIMTVPVSEIMNTKFLATVIDGIAVHGEI
ncbi:amidohydrolase family-domain-containing protein [Desarmillaria tabescens]|uniref:Amidohydrolase family-domain-containing protein n=1 Tax=Armillaria tabescens TaxID=1929756 RepID=A0AA39ITT9_ARMTA|nr:amidohydrolase family-domain-containing protein [Desarmillaria tabescens]KAK0430387.1 amidohydrolase family-domain-containing protein [Desarmillaria tabescens]